MNKWIINPSNTKTSSRSYLALPSINNAPCVYVWYNVCLYTGAVMTWWKVQQPHLYTERLPHHHLHHSQNTIVAVKRVFKGSFTVLVGDYIAVRGDTLEKHSFMWPQKTIMVREQNVFFWTLGSFTLFYLLSSFKTLRDKDRYSETLWSLTTTIFQHHKND